MQVVFVSLFLAALAHQAFAVLFVRSIVLATHVDDLTSRLDNIAYCHYFRAG